MPKPTPDPEYLPPPEGIDSDEATQDHEDDREDDD